MNRKKGKAAVRTITRRLGGRKVTTPGNQPDIEGIYFIAEVKEYLKAPKIAFRELRRLKTLRGDKVPLFIYRRPEWPDYIVCCFLKDFEDWFGTILRKS